MTHRELVERARRWLEAIGCGVVLCEVAVTNEIPDAIGYTRNGSRTYLLECKASRNDFHSDKNKPHRNGTIEGLGNFRYYVCEPNVITIDDLPPRWGLIYVYEKQVRVMHGYNPRIRMSWQHWHHKSHDKNERALLYSACRRIQELVGHDPTFQLIHRKLSPLHNTEFIAPD